MSGELNLTYGEHFAPRADGRYVCTMAAHMAMLRDRTPELALPRDLTEERFAAWQADIKAALTKQLRMPAATAQPAPVQLSCVQRDGYRVEKWEFYPDDYTVVPFLILVPDGISTAPAVLCYLGDADSKEAFAGEPALSHPNCVSDCAPLGQQFVRDGAVVFVFDTPGFGECSVMADPTLGQTQQYIREILCHGLLETGMGYIGLTVFQRLRFIQWLDQFTFVDQANMAIYGCGLGTEAAIATGVLHDGLKGLVLQQLPHDDRVRYESGTEQPGRIMTQDVGKWHILPGKMTLFGWQDLCAAFAPRYLGICEGDVHPTVERAYGTKIAQGDAGDLLKACFEGGIQHV